jgi:tetratricopeptide (TPR) repeat protein
VDRREPLLAFSDLRTAARETVSAIDAAGNDKVLALRLPRSWERLLVTKEEELDEAQYDRVRDVLRGIQDHAGIRILVLCGAGLREWRRYLRSPTMVRLECARSNLALLGDKTMWGAYADHAASVGKACEHHHQNPTPLQTRILVALQRMGADASEMLEELESEPAGSLVTLLRRLNALLAGNDAITAAVHRFAVARRPVPDGVVDDLTDLPSEHVLFSQCLGYPTIHGVRMTEEIRGALHAREALDEANARLVRHYKALDGVSDPRTAGSAHQMSAWLERAHHAALLTDASEWQQLEPPYPEFYWARGRWLSIVLRDYESAAKVFQQGTARFPRDDYGWHYYAWNLDKAGGPTREIDDAFRKALDVDETNKWWNSRYVTFLIRRAEYDRAEAEFVRGLERLRYTGTKPDLPRD